MGIVRIFIRKSHSRLLTKLEIHIFSYSLTNSHIHLELLRLLTHTFTLNDYAHQLQATAGVSEVALEAAALIGAAYTAGKDYANDLKNIKASTLTTSARLAGATRSTATNLVRIFFNSEFTLTSLQ